MVLLYRMLLKRSVTNVSRRDLHYYLDVLKTQSAGPPGSVVIDQALWTASRGLQQVSLCQSPHCVYMVVVESKRGGSQHVVQILQFSQSADRKNCTFLELQNENRRYS